MADQGETVITFEKMPRPGFGDEVTAWLVPARNNIQREMLRFRPVLGYPPLVGPPLWIFRARRLVLGVCFSLWRSVFQTRQFAASGDTQLDGLKFLNEIIHNNAATYTTELNAWSLEYYVENAVYRIQHARRIAIAAGIDESLLPEAHMLGESDKDDEKDEILRHSMFTPCGEWEECFKATQALVTIMLEAIRPKNEVDFFGETDSSSDAS